MDYYLIVRVTHDRKRINPSRLARQAERALSWVCDSDVTDTELFNSAVEDVRVVPAPARELKKWRREGI